MNLKNKKILITGHTGFKGAWLSLTLSTFGAKILGISKNIPTMPSLYEASQLKRKIKTKFIDIQNLKKINLGPISILDFGSAWIL